MSNQFIRIDVQAEINELIELELDPFDFKLYFLIRKNMDKETGDVGAKFSLCRNTLVHEMRTSRPRGSTKPTPKVTLQMIREGIKRLEKAGMLITKSINSIDEKRLILELPKAIRDESKFLRNTRGTTEMLQPEQNIDTTEKTTLPATDEQPRSNTRYQAISNNTYSLYTPREQNENKSSKLSYRTILSDYGFDLYSLTRQSVLAMYRELDDAEVTEEDIRGGVEDAHIKNGKRPDSPAYYKNFILSFQQQRLKNEATRVITAGGAGHQSKRAQKSYISNYAEKLAESDKALLEKFGKTSSEGEQNIYEDDTDVRPPLASDFDF